MLFLFCVGTQGRFRPEFGLRPGNNSRLQVESCSVEAGLINPSSVVKSRWQWAVLSRRFHSEERESSHHV